MDLEEYLLKKRKDFAKEYVNSKGENQACIFIALETAKYLILEFKNPYILEFFGQLKEDKTNYESFYPIKYSGKKTWGSHYSCCEKGKVYDPLSDKILPIEEFCQEVFGKNLNTKIVFNPQVTMQKVLHDFNEIAMLAH